MPRGLLDNMPHVGLMREMNVHPEPKVAYRGALLPFAKMDDNSMEWAIPGMLYDTPRIIQAGMDDPNDMGKMFDVAGTVAGGGFAAGRLAGGAPRGSLGMNVWQGGPNKYGVDGAADSLAHMSKGEGAQAYGWGRYDAENKIVGQEYKDQVLFQNNETFEYTGKGGDLTGDAMAELSYYYKTSDGVDINNSESISAFKSNVADLVESEGSKELAGEIRRLESSKIQPREGYLYKHDLPDEDIARYLDWDAPLSEQPESVRAAINNIGVESSKYFAAKERFNKAEKAFLQLDEKDPLWSRAAAEYRKSRAIVQSLDGPGHPKASGSGEAVYKSLEKQHGKQAASEALGRAGIPGLKYYDGRSRNDARQVFLNGDPIDDRDAIGNMAATYLMDNGGDIDKALATVEKRLANNDDPIGNMRDVQINLNDWAADPGMVEIRDTGTRNYVTWDQDVLNRMKMLERNGEDMSLLAPTGPGLLDN